MRGDFQFVSLLAPVFFSTVWLALFYCLARDWFKSTESRSLSSYCWISLIIVTTCITVFPQPDSLTNMGVSDSYEYLQSIVSLKDNNSYSISFVLPATLATVPVHEVLTLPPRYPPWFSVLFLFPVWFFSTLSSWVLLPTILCTFLLVFTAATIAFHTGGIVGATLATAFILTLPDVRHLSVMTMTDIPATALFIFALYALLRNPRSISQSKFFLFVWFCSLFFALLIGALIRPSSMVLFLAPCAVFFKNNPLYMFRWQITFLTTFVAIIVTLSNSLYNLYTFGDRAISGYAYWVPDFYNPLSNALSFQFLAGNLPVAFFEAQLLPLLLVTCALFIILIKQGRIELPLHTAPTVALVFTPYLLFFLFYFYPSPRFYLPLVVLLCTLIGGLIGRLSTKKMRPLLYTLALLTMSAATLSSKTREPGPTNAAILNEIQSTVPHGSVVLTDINPIYVSFYHPEKYILIPASEESMYFQRLAKLFPDSAAVKNWLIAFREHDTEPGRQLKRLNKPSREMQMLAEAKRLFLATPLIPAAALKQYKKQFNLRVISPTLWQLLPQEYPQPLNPLNNVENKKT